MLCFLNHSGISNSTTKQITELEMVTISILFSEIKMFKLIIKNFLIYTISILKYLITIFFKTFIILSFA